jgi:transposase
MSVLSQIKPHLTIEELRTRYRECTHPVEKVHYQVIYLRAQGLNTEDVARICCYNIDWVRRLVRRYNAHGPDALADGHRRNGRQKYLSNEQLEKLRLAVLEELPPSGGLWTGPKVALWMSHELGSNISPHLGWEYLMHLGMTKKTPRPRHPKASKQEQKAFKKKLRRRMMMIGRHHPNASIELWAQDEARLGLTPIIRRVWGAKGKRPIAPSRRCYEWVYVYGFVHPTSGRVEWLLLPTVNTNLFQLAIDYFVEAVGIGSDKHVILIIDQAGWHFSKKLHLPEGLHLFPLPAYSPELQPSERLWPLLRESVANREIKNMDILEDTLVDRCRQLREVPEIV